MNNVPAFRCDPMGLAIPAELDDAPLPDAAAVALVPCWLQKVSNNSSPCSSRYGLVSTYSDSREEIFAKPCSSCRLHAAATNAEFKRSSSDKSASTSCPYDHMMMRIPGIITLTCVFKHQTPDKK